MKLPKRLRYFNKKFTNRLMIRIAGWRYSPIGILYHYGRKTGNLYKIPILPANSAGFFIFELTYGDNVDWYRNLLASGSCRLVWHGREYHLVDPVRLPTKIGISRFPQPFRAVMSLAGIAGYFQMAIAP